jgi:hypothetical protein
METCLGLLDTDEQGTMPVHCLERVRCPVRPVAHVELDGGEGAERAGTIASRFGTTLRMESATRSNPGPPFSAMLRSTLARLSPSRLRIERMLVSCGSRMTAGLML